MSREVNLTKPVNPPEDCLSHDSTVTTSQGSRAGRRSRACHQRIVWGLIIALIALGLSIIFGLLDIINVAHGDLFMLGTVGGLVIAHGHGVVLDRDRARAASCNSHSVSRSNVSSSSADDPAGGSHDRDDFGLSMMLQEGVRATYGPQPRRMSPPIGGTVPLSASTTNSYRIFCRSVRGPRPRGVLPIPEPDEARHAYPRRSTRSETATALGIPVARICGITFALGTAMAALGGVIAAPITTVEFRTGVDILPFCFMAVVIGGLGQSAGHGRGSRAARRARRPRNQRHEPDDRAHRLACD